ncbi:MAG TPA: hypothetical protein DCW29_18600 [Janthinobacterium sp.]|nr:hypothetical protein [Janthinobacterium sp.]
MKLKSLLMTVLVASAGMMVNAAQAVNLSTASTPTFVTDGQGGFNSVFGNVFASSTTGDTFNDKYFFNFNTGVDSSASLTSTYLKSSYVKDLLITGFSLTQIDPVTKAHLASFGGVNETASTAHPKDSWSLTSYGLTSGSYFLEVDGKVVGNGGGTYAVDMTVSPVPEPEAYAMLLGGLGLIGFAARRRKAARA